MIYSKAQLRELALRARADLGQLQRTAKSTAIAAHLAAWPDYAAARTLCLYASFGSEVQTLGLFDGIFPSGNCSGSEASALRAVSPAASSVRRRILCLPRVAGRELVVHRVDDLAAAVATPADAGGLGTQANPLAAAESADNISPLPAVRAGGSAWPAALVRSPMGMPEPPASAPVIAPELLELVLVPGSAFSRSGGHRLGYGKGFYDQLLARAPQALKVGLCFDVQLFADEGFPVESHDVALDVLVSESGIIDLRRR